MGLVNVFIAEDLWPGTRMRVIRIGIVEKVVIRVRIRARTGCEEEVLEIGRKVAMESQEYERGHDEYMF